MRSLLISILAALMGLVASAAPVPKDAVTPLYFPTEVGAKWVWEDAVQVVTSVEKNGDSFLVKVGKVEGDKTVPVRDMTVSPRGVFEIIDADNQLPWVKLPVQAGESWEFGGSRLTVAGHEEVEVPTGRFKAVRVDQKWSAEGKSSFWLAPGIGLVKFDLGDGTVEVLKSFTSGKP